MVFPSSSDRAKPNHTVELDIDRQMALIRKMAAIGEESHNSRQQLRLCDLPDEILIRILSLLPTESAVRTCLLLFKRSVQQHLWKSLTSLEFHQTKSIFSLRKSGFINFVDRVMHLRDHSLSLVSFSLVHNMIRTDDKNRVKTWITKAVQCNVEHLTLSIFEFGRDYGMRFFPSCIFRCQSLVKLDLDLVIAFKFPSSAICLPRLKYLRLRGIEFEGDESTEKLLSSPLLKELIIDECTWRITSIHVCSPKLQILKIYDKYRDMYSGIHYGTKICIIADNLRYFSYSGDLMPEYRICASSTQLSKVEIDVLEEMLADISLNCYKILKGLSGTRNLALSDYFIKGLQNFSQLLDTIPKFECLTQLDIDVYEEAICIDSLALMKICEKCPHLEYLKIWKLSHTVRSLQLSPIPLCFRTHLKKILIQCYVPGDEDDAALDIILNNAFVLEELILYCEGDEEKDFHENDSKIQELQDKLNQRYRVSKDCIISVSVVYCIDR